MRYCPLHKIDRAAMPRSVRAALHNAQLALDDIGPDTAAVQLLLGSMPVTAAPLYKGSACSLCSRLHRRWLQCLVAAGCWLLAAGSWCDLVTTPAGGRRPQTGNPPQTEKDAPTESPLVWTPRGIWGLSTRKAAIFPAPNSRTQAARNEHLRAIVGSPKEPEHRQYT